MRRSRLLTIRLAVAMGIATAIVAAFWLGVVPPRLSPFAPLTLSEANSWFMDFRLAALRSDVSQCKAVLTAPMIDARSIPDAPMAKGCGWHNAVAMTNVGGARLSADKVTCEMAAALSLWIAHDVRPAAARYLGTDVKAVRHMGVFACRNILGSASLAKFRSQHATANAIDIDGFTMGDGRTISVLKHWKGTGPESQFLRAIHSQACRYFRVALGPDYNAAHANHFHLDRGTFKRCR